MIKETYLKEFDKENEMVVVSFEGYKEDINELRDYVTMINSVKYDMRYGIGKYDAEIGVKEVEYIAEDANEELCDIVNEIMEEEDLVNHPSHYTNSGMECILEMVMLYGFEETMSFCKLNCHKYRKRALHKNGAEDVLKSDWYMKEYKELLLAMETGVTPLQYVLSKMN